MTTEPRGLTEGLRALAELPFRGMPSGGLAARALLAGMALKKHAWERADRGRVERLRQLAAEAIFFELTCRNLGPGSMVRGRHGFFPHIFMPDYRGPHFDEALTRLTFPGRGPNILYFSLTGSCPCRCAYCFAGAGEADSPDLGDEAAVAVAREVARQRVPLVNLSGGEPLARYERLLHVIRVLSTGSEVRMFTSGIGLTETRLAELRAAGLKGLFVSLDGDDHTAFDRDRGRPGAFAAAVRALRLSAGADMLTFVNCVVDRTRFRTREEIARFLEFVAGIDRRIVVNFIPQLATGRGAQAASFRSPEECAPVAARIRTTARELRRPATMLFGRVDTFMGCPGAGGKLLNLDIAGNVTVCISRASLGNVLEEPFELIYRRFQHDCHRLKEGFFCCQVAGGEAEVLPLRQSRRELDRFYGQMPDAEWQRVLDRWGWALARLWPG